jgi:hypothetical protein
MWMVATLGDPELTVPILDAMSNLCLSPEDTEAVRSIVLTGLDSHEPEAMPVVVKFILQTVTSDNAAKVQPPRTSVESMAWSMWSIHDVDARVLMRCNDTEFFQVLGIVRTNLALESLAAGTDDADASDADASGPTLRMRHFAIQTLEALKAGVRFQQSTTTAWLKVGFLAKSLIDSEIPRRRGASRACTLLLAGI